VHEPKPELILESSGYRYGTVSEAHLHRILSDTRYPNINGSVYCESNQTLSLIIPVLDRVFPESHYIWLLRNGLDVVASAYQKQWYSGHSENHSRYEDCSAIEKAWIDGRIEGDQCGDMSHKEWKGLDRFGKCCWYWSYVNRLIEADLSKYAPDRFKLLRLEDMETALGQLICWMDLNACLIPVPKRHNAAKRRPYHWSTWTSDERLIFDQLCGDLMDRYYPEWRTRDGKWLGVRYASRLSPLTPLARNYPFVKQLNALFCRNELS
jgi:hypothetical protein